MLYSIIFVIYSWLQGSRLEKHLQWRGLARITVIISLPIAILVGFFGDRLPGLLLAVIPMQLMPFSKIIALAVGLILINVPVALVRAYTWMRPLKHA